MVETAVKPVQNGWGRKRRWPAEEKLAVLQEWKNGVPLEAESFFGSFKRDYVYQACLETLTEVGLQDPGVDRALQSGSSAQRLGDAVAGRVLRRMDSQKQETTCPQLSGPVHTILSMISTILSKAAELAVLGPSGFWRRTKEILFRTSSMLSSSVNRPVEHKY